MNNNFDPRNFDGKPSDYEQRSYSNFNDNYYTSEEDSNTNYNNSPDSQYARKTYYNEYTTDSYVSRDSDKKNKKKNKMSSKAGFIAIMLALSTAFGFGGSVLGNIVMDNNAPNTDGSSGSVITQSIVNTSNSTDGKTSIKSVVEATQNTVVEITTEVMETSTFMEQYVSEGAGSGVVITSDGYIITNNHVIDGASKITVTMKNGDVHEAKLIGTDPQSDIAVIKIEATGLQAAVLSSSDEVAVGDVAIAIGNPLGQLGGTVTEGIVSALDREITIEGEVMTLMQTSAAINPGNSGGGLFNDKGELIGVVNAKTSASGIEGLGFAIPIDTAKNVAKDLIEHGYVTGQIKMGISFVDILDNQTAMQYRVNELGVYVYQVLEGSDANKAGLESGDIMVSIDGTQVLYSSQIKDMMENYKVGDSMEIKIKRDGVEKTINLQFTEYKPQ